MFGRILLHLGVFLLYSIAVSFAAFLLPLPYGLIVALLILWAVLHFYLVRPGAPDAAERHALLRLRPLSGSALKWTLVAAPVMLVFSWSFGRVYVGLVPVPPRIFNPFGDLVLDPGRMLVITVLAIAAAPVVEEMFFRGLIQHSLEWRRGAAQGIVFTALLFALVHVDTLPWVIPVHFVLGAIFGWAVYATRSIWAGVILHAVNNAAAVVGLNLEAPEPGQTVWEAGIDGEWWLSLALLLGSALAGLWVARNLRDSATE